MPRVVVGPVSDFPDHRGVAVAVARYHLAVFRIGLQVFAIDDACPHRNFPLHDGTVSGLTLRCRTHGSCFDLVSGTVQRAPARRGVRVYPATIVADCIEVDVPD